MKGIIAIIVIVLAAIVIFNGFYRVDETQQVIVTQFGQPIGGPVTEAGLHWKKPFIQKANYFEKRVLSWDGDPNMIPTKDKKYIWVDTTARWKIVDPLLFLQSVRSEREVHSRLDDILDGATRNEIADRELIDIVRNSNRILEVVEDIDDVEVVISESALEAITPDSGREQITRNILAWSKPRVKEYGVDLIDIRIKKINYNADVRTKVFERMISERKRVSQLYRAEGKREALDIEGQINKDLQRIQSEAYREAQEIQGKADAEATNIYAEAYNRDPEFYSFLNTMTTYRQALKDKTFLILSTGSDYLKYITGYGPEGK
ncbi:MAG: protease modulator HflC [Candidatus Tritonobacter lacicola]|nr:protease modulator HflC [Candidatus Tritonobacter lacicola]